ncbi:hypothetical protein NE236_25355 [Actinoallomurus purpureus]|uniref:hypothetical protein n=1 Tax=Actinoallomurus purpureus TaxID=478114 RepID=UPI002093344A|nr:hypothetical protein [Actinoallomurus purpureus]MCO6008309.1 hypothetical protein [Actinoallomurus purpureus]
MKKVLLTGAAVTAFAISGLGLAGSASAAPVTTAGTSYCHLTITAKTNVRIHKKPSMSKKGNPILGMFLKGHHSCSPHAIKGGGYRFSGTCKTYGTDHYWNALYKKSHGKWVRIGYVPNSCTNWKLAK